MAFFSDLANLVAQMLLFYYIGKLVPPDSLPSYGGVHGDLHRVRDARHRRQRLRAGRADPYRGRASPGTDDRHARVPSLTPTAAATVQLGSAVFDLVYMPLRTRGLPGLHGAFVGVELDPSGIAARPRLLLAFIPFVWGIGIAARRAILTFKRGRRHEPRRAPARLHLGRVLPARPAPRVGADVAAYNPLAVAIEGLRTRCSEAQAGTGVKGTS